MKTLGKYLASFVMLCALSVFTSAAPFYSVTASAPKVATETVTTTCTDTNTTIAGQVRKYKTSTRTNPPTTYLVPVSGIAIGAFDPSNGSWLAAYGLTDADGIYVIEGLQPCHTYNVAMDFFDTTNPDYNYVTYPNVHTDQNIIIGVQTDFNPFQKDFVIYQQ